MRVHAELSGGVAMAVGGVALAVLITSSAIAWSGDVPEWEADALRFVNGWPGWLEPIMWVVQQAGVLGAPVVAGVVIAWSGRRWEYAVPFVLLVPIKLAVEWLFLKELVTRTRPLQSVGPDIIVRGPAYVGLSFPSGHATTATAFAILLVAFVPVRRRAVPIAWAAAVGIARLYNGEHNVLDVVGGVAVGTIYAMVLWFTILNRLVERPSEGSSA